MICFRREEGADKHIDVAIHDSLDIARLDIRAIGLSTLSYYFRVLMQGFRACRRDQRAMKTDEVCARPLETFGVHFHVP